MTSAEIPLGGGNMSGGIVRVGETVRRPAGPWTPAVHALLDYLHSVGFHGAPRALGLDDRGREVLTFIPGIVAWPDHVYLLHSDDRLRRLTRLIRDFHGAVAKFRPPEEAQWQTLIPADKAELIAHHDLAPWNLVINEDQWAFIDWDLAAPGSRLWDLAYAIHGFVPLTADIAYQRSDASHRLRLIADSYGLTEPQRREIVPMLARRTRTMHTFLADQAVSGAQPWTRLWQEGHGEAWQADTDYIAQREGEWLEALLR